MKSVEFLQQKINDKIFARAMQKDGGRAEWVTGMYFLLLLIILLCMQLDISLYTTAGAYIEDALAASNLASAVIDPEEYGISHTIRIADTHQAYQRYLRAVEGNLCLNANGKCQESGVIAGHVSVVNYTIYNVEAGDVTVWQMSEDGNTRTIKGKLGAVRAPNGQVIENTSVYSEISFPVKGMFGICVQAHKGKLVDILAIEKQAID